MKIYPGMYGPIGSMSIVKDVQKQQLDKNFDGILIELIKHREEVIFDLNALLRDQDDGACQIWFQPIPLNAKTDVFDIDSLVENLIEYTDKYFVGTDEEEGIRHLIGDAEDMLSDEKYDDLYLRKACREKFYDWKVNR